MIKIAFCDFWPQFNIDNNFITEAISSFTEYVITSYTEADYVFYSVFGNKHWEVSDECIKIFYTGENLCPDFNACDYAIGFEWLEYNDRYLRYPLYHIHEYEKYTHLMETKHIFKDIDSIKDKKKDFCSFVVSNNNGNIFRKELFEQLSQYKQVNSGGKWLNNVGKQTEDKLTFESQHKFSIACENSSHPGYTTEKLIQAFAAHTIPIYWGDPWVTKVFNPKSFINAHDYNNINEIIDVIIALDNNDHLYYEMLEEPALLDRKFSHEVQQKKLSFFLKNIIFQPIEIAKRRNRELRGKLYIEEQKKHFITNIKQETNTLNKYNILKIKIHSFVKKLSYQYKNRE